MEAKISITAQELDLIVYALKSRAAEKLKKSKLLKSEQSEALSVELARQAAANEELAINLQSQFSMGGA